jgi:hypothetical protein
MIYYGVLRVVTSCNSEGPELHGVTNPENRTPHGQRSVNLKSAIQRYVFGQPTACLSSPCPVTAQTACSAHRKGSVTTDITKYCVSRPIGQHSCFLFGKSRVQISAWEPPISCIPCRQMTRQCLPRFLTHRFQFMVQKSSHQSKFYKQNYQQRR